MVVMDAQGKIKKGRPKRGGWTASGLDLTENGVMDREGKDRAA